MTNLPEKVIAPLSQTKHADLYKAFNQLIDYVAEREPKPEKKRSVWDLKIGGGEMYWVLSIGGEINSSYFNHVIDKRIREAGNAFLTIEEAIAELARRKEAAKRV